MKHETIVVVEGKEIDLAKITRLYPAALIHAGGESASVSLEWAELKSEQITLEAYQLICDFDPVGEVPLNRVELRFETKEGLFRVMQEMAKQIKNLN
jgi:5S rRNA maturation endonuclease (ribonuclease M5)